MAAVITDGDLREQAGLPKGNKYENFNKTSKLLDIEIRKLLRIKDEQDAITRYEWTGIPMDLSSEEIERMLYYKGTLAMIPLEGRFYLMPYVLNGTIDFYGRYNEINAIPYVEGTEVSEETINQQRLLLATKKYNVKWGIFDLELLPDDYTVEDLENDMETSAVILFDYSRQRGQKPLARSDLQEPILGLMSEQLPFMNTALLNGTGISGWEVPDADCKKSVDEVNTTIKRKALDGEPFAPIVNSMPKAFNVLSAGTVVKGEEYQMAFQSLNNIRLSMYGLENGGAFEKKAHILQSEANQNGGSDSPYYDGLHLRQNFCNIVNSIWGTHMWCDMPEFIAGMDTDGDGLLDQDNGEATGSETEPSQGDGKGGEE